jgi:hypothetical protein
MSLAQHDPEVARLLLALFVENRTIYAGGAFDEVWKDNLRAVLDTVTDHEERHDWAVAFRATRPGEAAYLARGGRSLTVLGKGVPDHAMQ